MQTGKSTGDSIEDMVPALTPYFAKEKGKVVVTTMKAIKEMADTSTRLTQDSETIVDEVMTSLTTGPNKGTYLWKGDV